jgi:hypothetical protein
MRRALSILVRMVVVAAVVGVVRAVRADRSPERSLHGLQPVVGSIDTWPTVPRRPADEGALPAEPVDAR